MGINFDSYQDSAATSTWLPLAFFRAIARCATDVNPPTATQSLKLIVLPRSGGGTKNARNGGSGCRGRFPWQIRTPSKMPIGVPTRTCDFCQATRVACTRRLITLTPCCVSLCRVAGRYHLHPEKSLFPRRKVYGLILWIGSNDRYNMLRSQMESVRLQHARSPRWADEERIFGWAATEDVYPCKYVGSVPAPSRVLVVLYIALARVSCVCRPPPPPPPPLDHVPSPALGPLPHDSGCTTRRWTGRPRSASTGTPSTG